MADLPHDALMRVFGLLSDDLRPLFSSLSVSKTWNRVGKDGTLWLRLHETRWPAGGAAARWAPESETPSPGRAREAFVGRVRGSLLRYASFCMPCWWRALPHMPLSLRLRF